jgi:hypothetical protein
MHKFSAVQSTLYNKQIQFLRNFMWFQYHSHCTIINFFINFPNSKLGGREKEKRERENENGRGGEKEKEGNNEMKYINMLSSFWTQTWHNIYKIRSVANPNTETQF